MSRWQGAYLTWVQSKENVRVSPVAAKYHELTYIESYLLTHMQRAVST
jgi:hypothetical protein